MVSVWDWRCPPRCIQLHTLRKLLHIAFGKVFLHVCTGALFKGLHHAVSITARSLRAPLVECVGVQVDAPFFATRLLLVFCFLLLHPCQ